MMPSPHDCEKAMAALLACTKRRSRPLNLVAIYENLKTAVRCSGSLESVAASMSISYSMLKRFECVDRLHPDLKTLVASRKVDSIDSVAELCSLPMQTQKSLATLLPLDSFNTEDIRGCVRLINRHPEMPIDKVIKKVTDSKTVKLYIYEFVISESIRDKNIIKRNVKEVLSSNDIADIELRAAIGRLKVFKSGRQKLSKGAKSRRMSVQKYVQLLCKGDL